MADKRRIRLMDDLLHSEMTEGLSGEELELVRCLAHEIEHSLDPRELRRRGTAGIAEMAVGGLGLLRTLHPEETRLRVGNPGSHRSGRTTVEVATHDAPFLVDTLRLNLRRLGLREMLMLHPLIPLDRDPEGLLLGVHKDGSDGPHDAYLYAEVPFIRDPARRAKIERELSRVHEQLHKLVRDHRRMVEALRRHVSGIEAAADALEEGPPQADRIIDFLEWLADDNYIFFGYRYYDVSHDGEAWSVAVSPQSGLGMLHDARLSRFAEPKGGSDIPPVIRARLADERIVFFDKSQNDSEIHRAGKLDCIRVKAVDADARVIGFGQFVGMLTHRAIRTRGSEVAILRERGRQVLEILELEPGSYSYKMAAEAYDSLPVEVLFQFEVPDLARAVERIVSVTEQNGLGVYLFPDPLSHSFFVSAILPRSRYDEDLRRDLEKLLRTKYGATHTDNRVSFLDDQVALIHFFCSASGEIDLDALQGIEWDIQSRVARWEEGLEAALLERLPEDRACALVDEYGTAFPERYRVVTPGHLAVQDVEGLERLRSCDGRVQLDLQVERGDLCRLKVYQPTRPYLTDLLPTLDYFDLRVVDATLTEVSPASCDVLWIVTARIDGLDDLSSERRDQLLEALRRTLSGQVRDDELHSLILRVGLDWREVSLLRAYLAYAHQIGVSPSRRFLSGVLATYPDATRALVDLFRARFDPDLSSSRDEAVEGALRSLERARARIRTTAEDRVFSLVENLVQSTVRTSYFAPPIGPDPLIALKLDPSRIHQMPAPRPFAEIYVHSAAMSGIHLRGGPVARGGVRWSDRPGDFRTEVLGLMKTQMVKNGLIVPVGSKGGFVLLPPTSEPRDPKEVERQYERFIRGLLALTDDRVDGQVVSPDRVVCHDGEDPYLVVAPDKGTARFSDVANRVAEEVGFWLGDAFASGGSEGYDHKREGITARGAWVCVLRHFQELGIDVEREPFTVVGIGDMSGDVFGNGMLLARRAKLLAAFNHQHILLDPTPDPEVSWQERRRLFELQHSSWSDYDPAKISEGGGVYDRSAKEIPLSSRAQEMLSVREETLTGEELIRAILRMPVDLLLNGGIGTYVKATSESHADVGDRANDAVRVDARELRARVVGEGGNLGLTSRARVEFALAGGRINTDAIDNSGGVDLSDHEVNFKILLAPACRAGALSRPERNRILSKCLPEALEAVLSNSASHSLCLSLDERRSREDPEDFVRAAEFLARVGGLDPKLEGLPSAEEIRARAAARTGPVYTRPELAVLLGFTKMLAKRSLLESVVPDLKIFNHLLAEYFPVAVRDRFREEIQSHPLRREITATVLASRVVDCAGVTLLPGLTEGLGVDQTDTLAAYQLAGRILEADRLREVIHAEALPEEGRLEALVRLEDAVRGAARTLIGLERQTPWSEEALEGWRRGQRGLREHLAHENGSARSRLDAALARLRSEGFPHPLAEELAWLPSVVRALPVLPLVDRVGRSLSDVVRSWVRIGEAVRVSDLLDRLDEESRHGGWDRLAAEGLTLELLDAQRQLTAAALMRGEAGVQEFLHDRRAALERIGSTVDRIEGEPTLAPAAFLVQQLRRLC